MDLNFYLGLPRSTRLQSLDLGSDLTPSSLYSSTSFPTEDIPSSLEMSSSSEPTASHAPYSPSHASINPGPSIPLTYANSNQQDTPSFPSYEQYRTLYSPIRLGPNGTHYHTPAAVGMPTPQGLGRYEPYGPPYDPLSPSYITLDPPGMGAGEQLPVPRLHSWRSFSSSMYSAVPSYVHTLPSPPPLHAHSRVADLFDNDDDLSPRSDLIESRRRMRLRRSERHDDARSIPPSADQIMLYLVSPERSSDTSGKFRLAPKGILEESLKEKEERNKAAANFECNICMDMAQEPVVTSCGHLYCWPCLYQWLHVHSGHQECPVCKGEVTEANITPIYGRGDSEYSDRKNLGHKEESNTKIPSRPHGNRLESSRQQLTPISQRLREGLASSWGRVMHQEMLYNEHHLRQNPILTSPRRLLTEELNVEIGGDAGETRLPRDRDFTRISHSSDTNPIFYDRNADFLHQLAATTADIERMLHNSNRYEASTSSANHRSHEQLIPRTNVESISAVSSTAAVIQGDVGFTDSSALLNGVGSFGSDRRRGRSSSSGSFDVDDGFLHARKRRRLN